MGSSRFLALAGVAWCSCTMLARAQLPTQGAAAAREQCLAHHEQAQDDKLAGKLLAARASLRECSSAVCPALVSHDCVAWLSDVEQQVPSVIFRAAKDGEDLVALRVSEDGQLLTESITGTPLELDPGPHHFVAELPGFSPQAATYVLQAGDKGRVVRFDFVTPARTPTQLHPAASPPPPGLWRPVPPLTYALGGVTLAAVAAGGVLGALALSKRQAVETECAPLCTEHDVRAVKQLALASDISFALALVGAGATIYSYAARPSVRVDNGDRALAPAQLRLACSGLGFSAEGSF